MTRSPALAALALVAACHGGGAAPSAPAPQDAPAPVAAPMGAVTPHSPLDPSPTERATAAAPAPAPASASLYQRLGGIDAIRAVVHDFVGRVGADERINAFFRGVDLPNLERLLSEQICVASGGPCTYTGRSMRTAHAGMNLTDAHFNALVEDLVAALDHFNVASREKGDLLAALSQMKPDIVGH